MSVSLSVERDRIQRQVEELEQSLSATYADLELLSSETGDESDDDSEEETGQSAAGLLAQREQIQKEIQNLENVLGPHSPDDDDSSSSEESELGLSPSADSCLQMNLVYQQVVQETLGQLETLLTVNHRQQKELVSQLSGPIKESSRERPASSSCQQPINMYLGRFLKPYFKDNLTGLGPPANQETKEKASRMTGCLDDQKLKVKRWESWQKTLLIHAVTRDSLRRLVQPKLSKVDYLSQKLSRAVEADRQQLRQQIDSLEREIDLLRRRTEKELIGGDRFDEHDWQKIANVDFEGTRDAEDIRSFWQNFLHPSIRKTQWSQEEVQRLKEISRRHGDRHWEDIAAELGTGRTAFLCLQTFQRFVSDSLKRGSWTPVEDFLLRELVDKMRIGNFIPYTQMSYFMEGRDPAQLIYRWNQVLDPSLKKGFWTKEEDLLLLQAVSRYGEKDWCKIRFEVPGRTDSSCRDRYYDCLKAETRRGPFDQQERQLLLMLVKKHGVGRWAKIAAEIPDRYDAQCLREWRKLSKQAPPPRAKKDKTTRNDPTSGGGAKKKRRRRKKASPARKSIKRRLMELKEEESSEDDGMVVVYMDSDEEETKKKKKEVVEVEKEKEEEEEEYTFPPMQEWIPIEEAQSFTFLNFRPVELFSSGVAHNHERVRSTILGQFGRSVIVGPSPRELQWAERHSSSTMMMVSPDQLRAHLYRQVQNFNNRSSSRRKKIQIDKRSPLGRVTDIGLGYELQAAVTPWIGNLLIPPKHRLTTADSLRERGEKTRLPSTPVFLLLLQTLNVDSLGCKEMIEQRKKRVVSLAPPPPPRPSSVHKNTVAGMLQQRKAVKEETQMFDQQHKLILKQLQALQQQQKQKQQPLLLSVHPPPPPLPPHPPSNHPSVLLQMPPNMHRWMSPMSFPQAVFIPHPVTQPHASSIQSPSSLNTPPPAPHRPPPVGVDTSPRRLSVPPVSGVPVPLNATSTCSASSRQEAAAPLTQSLPVALPPSPNRQGGGDGDGGGCTGEDGAGDGDGDGDGMVAEGRRIRKPSQKAKALQEATEAKAGAKKKAAPSPRKRTPIQTSVPVPPQTSVPVPPQTSVPVPPQTSVPVPPQTSVPVPPQNPSLRLNILPVSVNSSPLPLNATLACSDRNVSSTLVPPPSIPTNQHLASSTSSRPAPFSNDHDYTSFNLQPGQRGSNSTQLTTDSASNQPSKAPRSRRRKRGRGEEHPGVTSSQDDQCVGGTGDAVDKTDTGAIQEGKRVRQPTERLRALQEATQAKAEAKKKRASPSSPRRKRSCPSRPKEEVVVQDQPVTQPSGFCLLPGQSMWVMTPGGLVQLAMVPSAPLPAPPPTAVSVPVNLPVMNQPRPFPVPPTCASKPLPPAFILHPVSKPGSSPLPSCPPQPPSKFFLPYKGTVRVDPAAPPPLRREALQFDPSLMFLESQGAVRDWLSGRGGVVVPGLDVALPYLPPFVSSLSTLSALLRAKKSLTTSSLQLLSRGSEPQRHPTTAKSDSSTERTSSPHPDLPDSTSDLRPAQDTPAPSVNPDLLQEEEEEEEEEAELVVVARQLVAERFSGNPAYQLLKARFLSCFTVPALMATVQPIREKTEAGPANEEEEKEEEEEEELKKIQERGRRRRVERSLLLCDDGSGAPAGHFSGIITNTTGPERSGAVGTGAERSGRNRSGAVGSGAVGTGAERSGRNRSGRNRSGAERSGRNRSGAVGTGAERSGRNRSGAEQ